MCAAAAVQIHALALFFAGCSLFAICHFWPFAGQPGDRCLCEAGIPGALISNAMVFKNI